MEKLVPKIYYHIDDNSRFVKWLTYKDCPVSFIDTQKIQALMMYGFDETTAKIASLWPEYEG